MSIVDCLVLILSMAEAHLSEARESLLSAVPAIKHLCKKDGSGTSVLICLNQSDVAIAKMEGDVAKFAAHFDAQTSNLRSALVKAGVDTNKVRLVFKPTCFGSA